MRINATHLTTINTFGLGEISYLRLLFFFKSFIKAINALMKSIRAVSTSRIVVIVST